MEGRSAPIHWFILLWDDGQSVLPQARTFRDDRPAAERAAARIAGSRILEFLTPGP